MTTYFPSLVVAHSGDWSDDTMYKLSQSANKPQKKYIAALHTRENERIIIHILRGT
jgi:hypothetical protein